nr:AI-2E family transporter [Lautropia sp.]
MTLPNDVIPTNRHPDSAESFTAVTGSVTAEAAAAASEASYIPAGIRVSLVGSFIILLLGAIYFAKEILLPVALAFMLTLTLSPVVRYLSRFRIPEWLSALVIVLALVGGSAAGVYYLSGPVRGWIDGAPETGRQIRDKIAGLRGPVDAAMSASKQVEEIAAASDDPSVQKVVLQQPGIVSRAADGAVSFVSTAGITIVLLFFLLASGKLFYEKLVRILPTLSEKKRAIRVVHAVEEEVSVYLLTITAINAGLGVAIAGVTWSLGLPNPILWGLMAAVLNFIPYLGALIGISVVAIVALVTFDSPGMALLPPALYFFCAIIEGQFMTPALLGKRLEMNTVAVFLAVAFWGWLWGVLGALMAVPILVSVRVLCDHFEGLSSLGEFLSGPTPEEAEPSEPRAPAVAPSDARTAWPDATGGAGGVSATASSVAPAQTAIQ